MEPGRSLLKIIRIGPTVPFQGAGGLEVGEGECRMSVVLPVGMKAGVGPA